MDQNELIDYWMTQPNLDLSKFEKKLNLRAIYSQKKQTDKITLNDFKFLKCLGKGACGSVYLVRNLITGYVFALKQF